MAPGEVPHEPAVHGSEQQVTLLGSLPQPGSAVEQPAHFRSGEIRGERQAAPVAEAVLAKLGTELAAERVGARVLPDDGVVHGLAGMRVPHHGGLTLVGDTNGNQVAHVETSGFEGAMHDFDHVAQDLAWVVLDPPRPWKYLLVLLLAQRDDPSLQVENQAS